MTIKQIEYFLAICELTQVNGCAKKLGISQSALSIAIKNLEISLGGPLFDRIAKTLILNERGRAFKKAIVPVYEELIDVRKSMQNSSMYNIKLISSQNIGNYLLPEILCNLLNENLSLDVDFDNTQSIIKSVVNNECDVGIIEGRIHSDDVKIVKICDDELKIVTGDPSYANKSVYIDEISQKPWINRESGSGCRGVLYDNLPNGIVLNTIIELKSVEAIKRCIKDHKAFACLPKFTYHDELNMGIYEVDLKNIKFKRTLNIVYLKNKKESEAFLKIINEIRDRIKKVHEIYSKD